MFRTLLRLALLLSIYSPFSLAQQPPSPAEAQGPVVDAPPLVVAQAARKKEDWTNPLLDRAVLVPMLPGVSLGHMETESYTRELIRLQWRAGDPVDIYVVMPRGVVKPRLALYLYSYPSSIDRFMDDGWCRRATRSGLAAVGLVSALTGDRFRGRPMREWFIPELQESLGSSAHDIQLILDYLANRGDLTVGQVGIYAQGSGASIAILAAAVDPRIQVLDLLNPWGDWPEWIKATPLLSDERRAELATPEFFRKVSMLDPVDSLQRLKVRALRVQQIMDDPDTPAAARDKIAAAVPAGSLVQYKNQAAHREAWKGLTGWMAGQLLPVPAPKAPVSAPSEATPAGK